MYHHHRRESAAPQLLVTLISLITLLSLLPLATASTDTADSTDATTCSSEIFPVDVYTTVPENTPTWKLGMIGLYPFSTAEDASLIRFAVDYINQNTDILTNTSLELFEADTTGNLVAQSTTIASVAEVMIDGVKGLVGGSNLVVMQNSAQASADFLIPHVGTVVQDVALGVKATYPYMLRAIPSYREQAFVTGQLLSYFGWNKATLITTSDGYGTDAGTYILTSTELKAAGFKFTQIGISNSSPSSIADYSKKAVNLVAALQTVKVVLIFTNAYSGFVFLQYMETNFHNVSAIGSDVVYVLSQLMCIALMEKDPAYKQWWHLIDGSICMYPRGGDDTSPLYQAMSSAWLTANQTLYPGSRSPASFNWYGVDGVFSHAYAVRNMVQDGQNLNTVKGSTYLAALKAVSFTGTTGPYSYDATYYDRRGTWDIYNTVFNNQTNTTTTTRKGWYRSTESSLSTTGEPFVFYGGRTDVPIGNSTIPKANTTAAPTRPPPTPAPLIPVYRNYRPGFGGVMGFVIGICVLIAIFAAVVQAFNWPRYGRHGPFYCAVILSGVFMSYVAALTLVPEPTNALCMAFPWLLGIAFNLVYGCLFIKTWVLYGVFRKAAKLRKTNLTPFYILKVLSAFIAVEAILMIVWTVIDPPTVRRVTLSDHSYEYQCKGDNSIFWIVFLAYKGAWLIFGSGLSFLTRNMAQEYNESKNIAYAIYADIALIIIAVPLAISIEDLQGGVIIVEVIVIALSFTFTLVVLFSGIWKAIFFGTDDGMGVSGNSRSTGSKTSKSGSQTSKAHNSSNSSSGPPTSTVAYNPPPVSSSGLYLA